MARGKVYDLGGQKWCELWEQYHTAANVAKVVGCSPQTAYKYGHKYGVKIKSGPTRFSRPTKLKTYLNEHPEAMSLPPSVIAREAGVSMDAVKSYTYRMRRRSRRVVNAQPWRHNGPPHILYDVNGVPIPDRAWDVVRAYISKWGNVKFVVTLKTGKSHEFLYRAYDIEEVFNG